MKYVLIVTVIFTLFLAGCNDNYPAGIVVVSEDTDTTTVWKGLVIDRIKKPGMLKDSIVVFLLTGFENDSIKICASDFCSTSSNIRTDKSLAFAATMAIPIKGAGNLLIYFKGKKFVVPIKKTIFLSGHQYQ